MHADSGSSNSGFSEERADSKTERPSRDDTLCFCFHISRRKIVNYVKRERPRRASLISQCFGAGSGCGWCIPFLIRLHEEIMGDQVIRSASIDPTEYEAMRKTYLQEVREGKRKRNSIQGKPQTKRRIAKRRKVGAERTTFCSRAMLSTPNNRALLVPEP